jgi:putative transposase
MAPTTLSAALDIGTGTVLTECKPRHRHQEFLAFSSASIRPCPEHLDVHLIVDNYATHKHARVRLWLCQRPRFHIHYAPTYLVLAQSGRTLVGLITRQAIRRGSFRGVKDLIARIQHFVDQYNRRCRPFTWTATADSMFQKLAERTAKFC